MPKAQGQSSMPLDRNRGKSISKIPKAMECLSLGVELKIEGSKLSIGNNNKKNGGSVKGAVNKARE